MWDQLIEAAARYLVAILIFVGIVIHTLVRGLIDLTQTVGRERTRREIAAYVAEGSLTTDQAERVLAAKDPQNVA